MRSQNEIFDRMLTILAQVSYPVEKLMYRTGLWENAREVLDLGSGNGAYVSMLADDYPAKHFTCVDSNSQIASLARNRCCGKNIDIYTEEFTYIPDSYSFDFLLARLVVTHIPEKDYLYSWAYEHASHGAGLLIVDTDIDSFYFGPELSLFSKVFEAMSRQSARGGLKWLRDEVEAEWSQAGFSHIRTEQVVVDSSLPGTKHQIYAYMCLVSEMALGWPIPVNLAEELFSWLINPCSYVKFGMFGALFERSNKGGNT